MSSTIIVSSREELLRAIDNVESGGTIMLREGNYGSSIDIRDKVYTQKVTITSFDDSNQATLEGLKLFTCGNIEISGLRFVSQPSDNEGIAIIRTNNSTDITIANNFIQGAINSDPTTPDYGYYKDRGIMVNNQSITSQNVKIINNEIMHVKKGINIGNSENAEVTGNYIHDYREDGMYIGNSKNLLVESNVIVNANPYKLPGGAADHSDMMQINGAQINLIVRNNYLNEGIGDHDPVLGVKGGSQGIFAGSGDSDILSNNVLFENNIVIVSAPNGIYVQDMLNAVIRNNILLHSQYDTPNNYTKLILRGEHTSNAILEGNITGRINKMEGATTSSDLNNFLVDFENPDAGNYVGKIFANVTGEGGQLSIADFQLTPYALQQFNVLGADVDQLISTLPSIYLETLQNPIPEEKVLEEEAPVDSNPVTPPAPEVVTPTPTPTPTPEVLPPSAPSGGGGGGGGGGAVAVTPTPLPVVAETVFRILMEGTTRSDLMQGTAANEEICGLAGSDQIRGGGGFDMLLGGSGNDTLVGAMNGDILRGALGDDFIQSGKGHDTVYGGAGNDTIAVGIGNDYMAGGQGADLFIFTNNSGRDTIADFEIGIDKLQISRTGISVESILSNVSYQNGNATINLGNNDLVIVQNIAGTLSANDFVG